jgi:hypothetical protein
MFSSMTLKRPVASPRAETPSSRRGLLSSATPTHRSWASGWSPFALICAVVLAISAVLALVEILTRSWHPLGSLKQLKGLAGQGSGPDVLVMYVFSNTDPEYLENLKFFLREGVHPSDGCEYLFIVNRAQGEEVRAQACPSAAATVHLPKSSTLQQMLRATFLHKIETVCSRVPVRPWPA